VYNDLDLIFGVDLSDQSDLKLVKDVVMSSLLNFMPAGVSKERMSGPNLSEAYVRKLVKVYDDVNRWSLISLSNVRARNVELKFADRMRRQFEFSVDSFQVRIIYLLTYRQDVRVHCCISRLELGYPAEVGALFTTVFSIRVSTVSRVRVTLTVTVRVSRVSVMVSVRDSVT